MLAQKLNETAEWKMTAQVKEKFEFKNFIYIAVI